MGIGLASSRASQRGRDTDPQAYIDKAVKKYAGNTFVLPATDDGEPQKTFFIPKNMMQSSSERERRAINTEHSD